MGGSLGPGIIQLVLSVSLNFPDIKVLGARNKLCQQLRGGWVGEGAWQMLTLADKGRKRGLENADICSRGKGVQTL